MPEDLSKEALCREIERLHNELATARPERDDAELLLEVTTNHATEVELELEEKNRQIQGYMQRLQTELDIGRQIQADFLPETLPEVEGWQFGVRFKPAREVAGDFYDTFALPNNRIGFVVADVCDKGVGAALFMALTRSLLRASATQAATRVSYSEPDGKYRRLVEIPGARAGQLDLVLPADIFEILGTVSTVSDYITDNHSRTNMFATLFFAVLDPANGLAYYVNAGHDAPVHLGTSGVPGRLPITGPAVGVKQGVRYRIGQIQLEPGDLLLIYTDGVTEARNNAGTLFSEKRLLALLDEAGSADSPVADKLLDRLVQALDEHTAGANPSDDITILAISRT